MGIVIHPKSQEPSPYFTFLGWITSVECGLLCWVSRSLKPLLFLKSSYSGRSLLGLPFIHHFPGQLLTCRRSAGGT